MVSFDDTLAATIAVRLTKRLRETIGEARESEADREDTPEVGLLHRAVQLALWLPRSGPSGDDTTASDHGSDTPKPLCAKVDGFSLHAFRTVAPEDRAGLEQLCRYGLRAPFALRPLRSRTAFPSPQTETSSINCTAPGPNRTPRGPT